MEHVEAQLDAAEEREEMTERQPDSPAFCWATELAMTQQPVTLSVTEAREVSAGMQRLHTENTALQQGYAAARLEIESLQARIKAMAEEHADELMVAHLDGGMRAAQLPAPSAAAADEQAETMRRIGEGQAFEAWFKVDCPVEGVNARLAAKAAWQARAALDAPQPTPTPQADSQPAPANTRQIAECYGDCPTDPKTCANPCKFEGRAARAPADSVTAPAATCPTCKAPCTTTVNMRGGEHGWGTTDLERTVYHYAPTQAADSQPTPVPRWDEMIRQQFPDMLPKGWSDTLIRRYMTRELDAYRAARAPADSVTAPAATVIKKGAERQWMSERLGHLPDGIYSLYLAPPTQAQAVAIPLTDREIELIDGMIQVQLDHASRCDAIANRAMADKQKGWDMERVALLQKFKARGIKGGQHGAE